MTFQPATCECGHTVGEHKSGGTHWPHPPRFGICLVPGCDCREFDEVGLPPEGALEIERFMVRTTPVDEEPAAA